MRLFANPPLRLSLILLAMVVAMVAVIAFLPSRPKVSGLTPLTAMVEGVMGTETELTAVVPADRQDIAQAAFHAAEAELRKVDALMSDYLAASELSRFNAAPAGRGIPLSPPVMEVLKASRQAAQESDGAFDVTCRPLVTVWKQAGRQGKLPDARQIDAARAMIGWRWVRLHESGAEKLKDGVEIDLGGIAKGYGVDRAAEAMQAAGCTGGLVRVGGDIRCFGPRAGGGSWRVGVRDPFHPSGEQIFATLALNDQAVSTSGNYFRYVEIAGRRYSHIVDPRTGWTVDTAPSVTVIAPSSTLADRWATALSVLGPDGFARLPQGAGIEAMMVVGTPGAHEIRQTVGFGKYLLTPVSLPAVQTAPASAPAGTTGN